jgi:hypothetical protein
MVAPRLKQTPRRTWRTDGSKIEVMEDTRTGVIEAQGERGQGPGRTIFV